MERRGTLALAVLVAAGLPVVAGASLVRRFSEAELFDEAELVVEGRVDGLEVSRATGAKGLETRIRFRVAAVAKGNAGASVVIRQPGGRLGELTHVVVGMPELEVGEEARLFLVRRDDGDWRVLGWGQGKWVRDGDGFAPERERSPREYVHNGMVWPAATMPVPWKLNRTGSDDLPLSDVKAAVQAAFDTWQGVPCSTLSFQYAGETDLGTGVDGENVILFIESGWIYGTDAAAATSLFILPGQQTADVAMNGQRFQWMIGPDGSFFPDILDLQGVLTHELGHFSGLGHSQSSVDTMYYSWIPWQDQRSLSLDDKRGLCDLYPRQADECQGDADCVAGDHCLDAEHGKLCATPADPLWAPCDGNHDRCEVFCLFGAGMSAGHCSRFCQGAGQGDCPDGFRCATAKAGTQKVGVCAKPRPTITECGVTGRPSCTPPAPAPTRRGCGLPAGGSALLFLWPLALRRSREKGLRAAPEVR
jgi:hypothetical protein